MLRALGANVTVAARRKNQRDAAGDAVSIGEMDGQLREFDIIVNTVPALVLTAQNLPLVKKDARIIDLASPPYGVDLTAAAHLELNAALESALPARYAPKAAARIVVDYLSRRWAA